MCFLGGASSQNCENLVIVAYFLSSDYFSNAIYEFAVTLLLNVITVVTTKYHALCNLLICFQIIYQQFTDDEYRILCYDELLFNDKSFDSIHASLNQIKKLFRWFFCRFHTSFLDANPSQPNLLSLTLEREEIDNPHKERTWDIYTDKFSIKVFAQKVRWEMIEN